MVIFSHHLVNVILVVSHEKLNIEMKRHFGTRVQVVKIPKSGGTVELDHGYRERIQRSQIQSYFYGQRLEAPGGVAASGESGTTRAGGSGSGTAAAITASLTLGGEDLVDLSLSPLSNVISMDDLTIYRIGGGEYLALVDLVLARLTIHCNQNLSRLLLLSPLEQHASFQNSNQSSLVVPGVQPLLQARSHVSSTVCLQL